MTNPHARRAVVFALAVVLLVGCDPTAAQPNEPDLSPPGGVGADCDDGYVAENKNLGRYDINHDGQQEWFYRLRCRTADGRHMVDQVEIIDGNSDLGNPRRLGTVPLLHQRHNLTVDDCITFEGDTVYLVDRRTVQGWHVARFGTWRNGNIRLTEPKNMTVPCADPRPTPSTTR